MKPVKLILPDHIHQIGVDLAKRDDLELGQFFTGVLSDALVSLAQKNKPEQAPPSPEADAQPDLPDTIRHVHEVCRAVWVDGKLLPEAMRNATFKFGVTESSIRDSCTRRINLESIVEFAKLLTTPPTLAEHLGRQFICHASVIRELFATILPDNCSVFVSPPSPQDPPPLNVTEMDLVAGIVDLLRAHGGKLHKADAERELFSRFKTSFQHPHYQEEVAKGLPRWRKDVHSARNTACNALGLMKSPQDVGQGVWELTDTGRAWVRP